jgi:hypothetical protein
MKILVGVLALALGSASAQTAPQPPSAPVLDFEVFKTQVQPIFLAKRPGYTRCVVCHSDGGAVGFLQPLSPGATAWNDEQSRLNFENVSRLVVPGKPDSSLLLIHPLAHTAGGDQFHSGGRQFRTKEDPDWKILVEWVRLRN